MLQLEAVDYFYLCAEIGIALAGFAAIVVAIGQRNNGPADSVTSWYIEMLVERGLAAAFFALLPVLLSGLQLNTDLIWLLSSGLFSIYGFFLAWRSLSFRKRSTTNDTENLSSKAFSVLMSAGIIMILIQILNASGYLINQSSWWHAMAVTWLLISQGYLFLIFFKRSGIDS